MAQPQPPAYNQAVGDPSKQQGYPPATAPYPPAASAPYPPAASQPQYGSSQGYPPQQQQYGSAPPPQPAAGYGAPAPQNASYGVAPQPQSTGYGAGADYQPTTVEMPEELGFNVNSFSDKAVRHNFIKKVYLILFTQLLITGVIVAIFVLVAPVRRWVQRNLWFYIVSYVLFIALYITLVCCRGVRKSFPGNFIALGLFTLAFSYVAATIASFHTAEAVLIAAGITMAVCLAISIFAIQTKIDFTMCHGLMFAAGMTLLFAGIAFILIRVAISDENARAHYILQCVYGSIAALILSLFLVFDTQRVVGGKKRKYALSPEEYITGALELYLDIVYLFLIILSFFGGSSD